MISPLRRLVDARRAPVTGPAALVDAPPGTAPTPARTPPADPTKRRLVSLDALRGLALVILILVNNAAIHSALPYQLTHHDWHGLTAADTFFPVFLFAIGGGMVFSSKTGDVRLALRRTAIIFALGVFLYSLDAGGLVVGPGILQKIAVAYLIAWGVMQLPVRWQLPTALGILAGLWAAYTFVPAPGVVPGSWAQGRHLGAYIDTLVVGRPHSEALSSAIPAAVNVLGGAFVIRSVRGLEAREGLKRVLWWGAGALLLGLLVTLAVPVNKRIWTPSFVLVTQGIACFYLAAYWWLADLRGHRRAVRPFVVLGRNPIFIFVVFTAAHTLMTPVRDDLVAPLADLVGPTPATLLWSTALLCVAWALSAWLDRRRIYIRV